MHLTTETVLDLMDGRLEGGLERQWTSHLAECPTCTGDVDRWRELRDSLQREHLESAPPSLLVSALAIYQPIVPSVEKRSVLEIIATVIFDSFSQPAFAGARGVAAARQVVMRAGDYDIHLHIGSSPEKREMLGQIQPQGTRMFVEMARLHLLQAGKRITSVEVNEMGEFYFDHVPEGLVDLQVDMLNLTVIGALDITDRL